MVYVKMIVVCSLLMSAKASKRRLCLRQSAKVLEWNVQTFKLWRELSDTVSYFFATMVLRRDLRKPAKRSENDHIG